MISKSNHQLIDQAENKYQKDLEKYYGFSSLHSIQEESLNHLLSNQDLLAILPTGLGKSLIYQLFALQNDGLTIVISPLLALMFDQVEKLQTRGIAAAAWNHLTPPNVKHIIMRQLKQNQLKLLYLSPEKLNSKILTTLLNQAKVDFVAIDEAHCVSEWGPNFRPNYYQIGTWIKKYSQNHPRPICAAFSATADKHMVQDIVSSLELQSPAIVTQACFRPNIRWQIIPAPSENWKRYLCRHIIQTWAQLAGKKSGIILIYGATRLDVVWMAMWLQDHGFPETQFFHAGLPEGDKLRVLTEVSNNKQSVVVCTNAFGMGIDLPNVRLVIHLTPPSTMAAYVQEAGRGGRDGQTAYSITLFQAADWLEQLEYRLLSPDKEKHENKLAAAKCVWNFLHKKECLSRQVVRHFRLPQTPQYSLRDCECMYCRKDFPWNP